MNADEPGGALFSCPLSDTQTGFWVAEQLAHAPAYNEHVLHHVRGALDQERLRDAEQRLVDRHEVLRTTFGDEALQYVHRRGEADFDVIDARGWSDSRIFEVVVELAHRRFDYRKAPLLRARLIRCGDDEAYLLHVFHHLVLDGFSWMLAERELFECYLCPSSWSPPAPGRFADFVAWQRAITDGPAGERHWRFWREELQGATRIALPTDHPRNGSRRLVASSQQLFVERDLLNRLREVARKAGATSFGVLLAAVQILMARESGKDDVLVAVPSAGHGRQEFRRVLGPLANPLLVRAQLQPGLACAEVARLATRKVAAALEHQMVPFGAIATRMGLGGTGGVPFDVLVSMLKPRPGAECVPLRTEPAGPLRRTGAVRRVGELTLERINLQEVSRAPFDIGFIITEYLDRLTVGLRWDSELFERSTIESLARRFVVLLEAMAADPSAPIGVPTRPRVPTDDIAGRGPGHLGAPGGEEPSVRQPRNRASLDDVEERLARIWSHILKRAVARTEDFFDSGGDSLLAVRLISAIADEFGVAVAPRQLFEANTVELMAAVIRRAGGSGSS